MSRLRLWQVEVGEQGVDEAELEAGGDEDLRFAGVLLQRAALCLLCTVFQSADDCGADGDDAPSFGGGAIDGVGGCDGERVALAMQADFVKPLDTQRGEGAEADVEGDAGDFDAASGESVEDLRSKVQAGGGCCDGASFAGVNGLVALAIGGLIVAADIGRQWHVADAVEDGEEIVDRLEAEQTLAEVVTLQDLGLKFDCTGG